jgi:hypothetical protein
MEDADRKAWARRALLFALTAWPAWVVSVPPLQDLPNHLATAHVQLRLDHYPELVSNGFLKTNSALFVFLHVAGGVMPLRLAAKIFVTLVALVGAIAYPSAARALGRNERAATFVLWPMVHNWFVAMGMLDYALAVPLALLTLQALAAHRRAPSMARAAAAAALCVLVWYTHAFAVVMVGLLAGVEVVSTRKWRDAWTFGAPLAPALLLTAWSSLVQLHSETTLGAPSIYQGAASLLYGAFSEWMWPMSKWTLVSLASAAVLAWYGLSRWRARPPFFSPLAMGVLVALYMCLPYHAHRWFYVTSRVLPFVWMGFALRVPASLPVILERALGACALVFSLGLGVDYVHTAHDWEAYTSGEAAVPERSRLLPLVFDRKGPHGENTWPMLHAWGLYVVDKDTTAPLLFAHSRSFPVSYAADPPPRFHGIVLEQFPQTMRTTKGFCDTLEQSGLVLDACAALYRAAWDEFWRDATPRFDRVVMYGATPDVRAAIPPAFRVLHEEGETLVLATSSP